MCVGGGGGGGGNSCRQQLLMLWNSLGVCAGVGSTWECWGKVGVCMSILNNSLLTL